MEQANGDTMNAPAHSTSPPQQSANSPLVAHQQNDVLCPVPQQYEWVDSTQLSRVDNRYMKRLISQLSERQDPRYHANGKSSVGLFLNGVSTDRVPRRRGAHETLYDVVLKLALKAPDDAPDRVRHFRLTYVINRHSLLPLRLQMWALDRVIQQEYASLVQEGVELRSSKLPKLILFGVCVAAATGFLIELLC